ncbi:hypothetical protein F2Q69_00037919 [Brassica cretica]|uniref:Endoplasmic reticulum vesicle transporter C-terminal domain-containing protein n=1 Tax=Brassica cretica TaxID=69181 RepID=A0A8S9SV52_BRACR|nr:hypothetical protein F2Q69_00037919 [Brassica cretica]
MQLIPLQGGVSTPIKSPTAPPPWLKCDCTDEISVEEETSMLWSKALQENTPNSNGDSDGPQCRRTFVTDYRPISDENQKIEVVEIPSAISDETWIVGIYRQTSDDIPINSTVVEVYYRSWMDKPHLDPNTNLLTEEYVQGIREFMRLVQQQPDAKSGFSRNYKVWYLHGETGYEYGSTSEPQPEENDCCHSCEDVRDTFRNKGWGVTNPDLIDQDWVHKSVINTVVRSLSLVVGNAGVKIATLQLVYMDNCNYLTVDFFKKLLRLRECPLFFSVVVSG